jgi:hydroxypyruvate isomerase
MSGLSGARKPLMPNSEPFTLAVCAEMVFRSLPITERVRRISNLGFQV